MACRAPGKPLNLRPGATDGDYGQAWLRDYAQREGVAAEEMLPTPLRLRREVERLAQTAGEFRSEQEVRAAAAGLNRRIVEWRRIPVGPPVHVRLVNADDLVARWRGARSERAAQEAAARAAGSLPADPSPALLQASRRLPTSAGLVARAKTLRDAGRGTGRVAATSAERGVEARSQVAEPFHRLVGEHQAQEAPLPAPAPVIGVAATSPAVNRCRDGGQGQLRPGPFWLPASKMTCDAGRPPSFPPN